MDRRIKIRPHVVFVDDDETELATFRRLYEGDRFQVTTVCAQFPRSALPAIEQALRHDTPDLFVLDLFFPVTADQATGFTTNTSPEARAHLARVMTATQELEAMFIDDDLLERSAKELFMAGSDRVFWSQKMLNRGPLRYSPHALGPHISAFYVMCAGVLTTAPELGTTLTQSHRLREVRV